jgi:hypothetical protein
MLVEAAEKGALFHQGGLIAPPGRRQDIIEGLTKRWMLSSRDKRGRQCWEGIGRGMSVSVKSDFAAITPLSKTR